MIPLRFCLLILALVHLGTSRVRTPSPSRAKTDEDSFYAPKIPQHGMGRMMQMAYNQSIPIESIRACERDHSTACPSPSADGSHTCVRMEDICDHRPQCPRGEDETPVICFFHEMHSQELARLRQYAVSLYRQNSLHAIRGYRN